jgi:hypothetical protein
MMGSLMAQYGHFVFELTHSHRIVALEESMDALQALHAKSLGFRGR